MLKHIAMICALIVYAPVHALDKFISSYDARALPNAQGALVRAAWSDIETEPGVFDWSAINKQVAKIKAAKKGWSLAIAAGPHTPTFYATGPVVSYIFRGKAVATPVFWDTEFQAGLSGLLKAVAREYASDPDLRVFYLPQASRNGIEGALAGSAQDKAAWQAAGYTPDVFSSAVLLMLDVASAAMPEKIIAVELHETFGTDAQSKILSGLKARTNVAAAVWWMGQGTYQPALQSLIASSAVPVYAQTIASYKKEPKRFRDYNGAAVEFSWIEQMARDLGAVYIEYWPADVR